MEHGELGTFLLAFASALVGAKLFGELAERIGQPAVLGELLVGVILGPSVLGLVPLSHGVHLLAEVGVILLLFEVGLETDLDDLVRVGAPALAVAFAGMVLPFVGRLRRSRAPLGHAPLTAIFVGAALTATSIGITARVLSELKVLTTREGQIILGAAVTDDVLGLVVLAVVAPDRGEGEHRAAPRSSGPPASRSDSWLSRSRSGSRSAAGSIALVERANVRGVLVAPPSSFALARRLGREPGGLGADRRGVRGGCRARADEPPPRHRSRPEAGGGHLRAGLLRRRRRRSGREAPEPRPAGEPAGSSSRWA